MNGKSCLRTMMMLVLLVLISSIGVSAASVTKVTYKRNTYANYKQSATIKGYTKSGKNVWTYKTSKQSATELDSARCITNSKYVFIIDNNKYVRLNKNTGKVLVKKTLPRAIWGAIMKLDSSNNLYCIGYYSDTLYKIKPSGKVAWKQKFPSNCWWPYKIKVTKSKVSVKFDCAGNPKTKSVKNR